MAGTRLNGGVLIFGFGPGQAQDLGEVAPAVCPYCHNSVYFHQLQSKKSVRLYFVPVVPYGTDDYLLCPICSRGLQLSDPQLAVVNRMRTTTVNYRRGAMPTGYDAAVAQFWAQVGVHPDTGSQVVQPAVAQAAAPAPAPQAPLVAAAPTGAARSPSDEPPAPDKLSWLAELDELDHLHQQGVLTDESYETAKRRVLARGHDGTPDGGGP